MRKFRIPVLLPTLIFSVLARAESVLQVKTGREICPVIRYLIRDIPLGGDRGVILSLAPEIAVPGELHGTAQGNGHLEIANLRLRIYDDHDDGTLFQPRCLKIQLRDFDGSGIKAIRLSGTILSTDDKTGAVIKKVPFTRTYFYGPKEKNFERGPGPGNPSVEMNTR